MSHVEPSNRRSSIPSMRASKVGSVDPGGGEDVRAEARLLASSRAIGAMAAAPKAEELEAEWKTVEAIVAELMEPAQ